MFSCDCGSCLWFTGLGQHCFYIPHINSDSFLSPLIHTYLWYVKTKKKKNMLDLQTKEANWNDDQTFFLFFFLLCILSQRMYKITLMPNNDISEQPNSFWVSKYITCQLRQSLCQKPVNKEWTLPKNSLQLKRHSSTLSCTLTSSFLLCVKKLRPQNL